MLFVFFSCTKSFRPNWPNFSTVVEKTCFQQRFTSFWSVILCLAYQECVTWLNQNTLSSSIKISLSRYVVVAFSCFILIVEFVTRSLCNVDDTYIQSQCPCLLRSLIIYFPFPSSKPAKKNLQMRCSHMSMQTSPRFRCCFARFLYTWKCSHCENLYAVNLALWHTSFPWKSFNSIEI